MKNCYLRPLLALLLAVVPAACGDDGPVAPPEEQKPSAATGSLAVAVQGLPDGVGASVVVANEKGFSRTLTATQTLSGLAPGVYSVTIGSVSHGGLSYGTDQTLRYAEVAAGATASLRVEYRAFNLVVENFYITQSIQRYDRSIPLIAGRDGLLRVFARANNANTVQAPVRVRLYQGTELKSTILIPAPSFAATTDISEAALGTSWNVRVSGALIQPGLGVLVDIDPEGQIAEGSEADNRYPASGAPQPMEVRTVPTLDLVLVPVQQADGSVGNVTEANKGQYMVDLLRMFPVADYRVSVRAPYVYTSQLRGGNEGGQGWQQVVREMESVRVGDGKTGQYYYGVAKITYNNGIYGIAFRPGKAGVGNDYLDNRNLNASMTLAHELGHNMDRPHSQCGSAGLPDIQYPHPNGQIGSFGFDLSRDRLFGPDTKDLMGYCEDRWIGDFTYERVLAYRSTQEHNVGRALAPREPSLVVWGEVSESGLLLEPAYQVDTRPELPTQTGPYTLEGVDAGGLRLFALSFAGSEMEDVPGDARAFAFAVPLRMVGSERLAELRLSGHGRTVVLRAGGAPGELGPRASLRGERLGGGRVRLQWNATATPLVVLRDPHTGDIVSLVRGGQAVLPVGSRALEAIVSDGVRSESRGVLVP